jgi:GNAT superfamily N-acetyltransferase
MRFSAWRVTELLPFLPQKCLIETNRLAMGDVCHYTFRCQSHRIKVALLYGGCPCFGGTAGSIGLPRGPLDGCQVRLVASRVAFANADARLPQLDDHQHLGEEASVPTLVRQHGKLRRYPMISPTQLEPRILDDGTTISIRPIQPDDKSRLQAFHARLSPETIYGRFLAPHPVLTDAEADRFTKVDHEKRVALVATRREGSEEAIIAVARYDQLGLGHSDEAEAAIVVEDRFQGRGVGTILLNRLTDDAVAHGIHSFVAIISAQHDRISSFIRRSGLETCSKLQGGAWEVKVKIA